MTKKSTPPQLDEEVKAKRIAIKKTISLIERISSVFQIDDTEFQRVKQVKCTSFEELTSLLELLQAILRRVEKTAQTKIATEKTRLDSIANNHLEFVQRLTRNNKQTHEEVDLSALDYLRNTLTGIQNTEGFQEAVKLFKTSFQEILCRNQQVLHNIRETLLAEHTKDL